MKLFMINTIGEIMKVGLITLISQKALKALGKKDYSDIIKFCGICLIALELICAFKITLDNPVVNTIKGVCDFIKNIKKKKK